MTNYGNSSVQPLCGIAHVPSDKSITHRAILFSSIADGESVIHADTVGRDNLASLRVMSQLGVKFHGTFPQGMRAMVEEELIGQENVSCNYTDSTTSMLRVQGRGVLGLNTPRTALNCGNSGTTSRLLLGVLASQGVTALIDGDASLRKRPFGRVCQPLSQMGIVYEGVHQTVSGNDALPLMATGGVLRGIDYQLKVASAQVKSAILLAGLGTTEAVRVTEPCLSRNHTELLLSHWGCDVESVVDADGVHRVSLGRRRALKVPGDGKLAVPGDFSSAAFLLGAASVVPGSNLVIENVGFNDTRIGFYRALMRMGAQIAIQSSRHVGGERVVDLHVNSGELRGTQLSASGLCSTGLLGIELRGREVVEMIDEVPIFVLVAMFAEGETSIYDAEELRVKESDRLDLLVKLLRVVGIAVEERPDGFSFVGNGGLLGSGAEGITEAIANVIAGVKDHRIVMCAVLLNYFMTGQLVESDAREVETSFPGFFALLESLRCSLKG